MAAWLTGGDSKNALRQVKCIPEKNNNKTNKFSHSFSHVHVRAIDCRLTASMFQVSKGVLTTVSLETVRSRTWMLRWNVSSCVWAWLRGDWQPYTSTQTAVQSHKAHPPSVSEPVGDGQQQVILLQSLHPAQRLLIQSCVASPRVIQQLLLGRVKLPDLCHLLRGDQQQLCNGRSGGHRVAVHPVDLKRFWHVFQALVCEEDPLVAQQHSSSIFHCGQTPTFSLNASKNFTARVVL